MAYNKYVEDVSELSSVPVAVVVSVGVPSGTDWLAKASNSAGTITNIAPMNTRRTVIPIHVHIEMFLIWKDFFLVAALT